METPVSLLSLQPEIEPDRSVEQINRAEVVDIPAAPAPLLTPATTVEPVLIYKTVDELSVRAANCRLCSLANTRTQVVFGSGNADADIVFIGEVPDSDEDQQGEPFVGSTGKLLDRMLISIGLDRKAVYCLNIVKCRPPNGRDPRVEEVQACSLWLEQQLESLQPKVICALGRVAAQTLLKTEETLAELRGSWHDYQGTPVWVTYHPAFLLRSPQQKQKCWSDLIELMEHYGC
ncbi:MAG: uracil-DNA glycosylase [Mariprofundus sp.]|nr:uracil-DNA glycosylase [Mariprofundus sp.]